MNPDTGQLIALREGRAMPAGFEALPDRLFAEARRKLAGTEVAQVNVLSRTPLATWARDRRKEKRKAKIAAASRRRNRK